MNLLVISGSTRRGSFNTRLARLVRELRPRDCVTIVSDLAVLPFYDADVEAVAVPPAVAALRRIGAQVLPAGLSVAAAHARLGERVDRDVAAQVANVLAQTLDAAPSADPTLQPA